MTEYSDEPMRSKRDPQLSGPDSPMILPDANIFSFSSVGSKPTPAKSESTDLVPVSRQSHNTIFGSLVRDDADIAGFVAYGLYKQSKRDWCVAFEQEHRRPPSETEIRSYILGESTERRLATYRNLAAQVMQRREAESRNRLPVVVPPKNPDAAADPPLRAAARSARRYGRNAPEPIPRQPVKPPWTLVIYLLFLVLAVVGIAWLARYSATLLGFFSR